MLARALIISCSMSVLVMQIRAEGGRMKSGEGLSSEVSNWQERESVLQFLVQGL